MDSGAYDGATAWEESDDGREHAAAYRDSLAVWMASTPRYCFRCYGDVEYLPEDPDRPYRTVDRGTTTPHYWTCYDRCKAWKNRYKERP